LGLEAHEHHDDVPVVVPYLEIVRLLCFQNSRIKSKDSRIITGFVAFTATSPVQCGLLQFFTWAPSSDSR